ncbi:hypothetical protein Tco_1418720 [Tanacetum coccineum]
MVVFDLNQPASSLSEEDVVGASSSINTGFDSHVVSVSSSINTECDSFPSHDDNASSYNSLKTPKLVIHHEFIDTPGGSVYWVPRVFASVLPVLGTIYHPEIDTYRSQFKSKFPNKDMKEEFPDWFGSQIRQRHVDKDPGVSASSELFALAYGPTPTPISVNSCVVNGVRFVVHSHDERRTTQNSGICSPELSGSTLSNERRKVKHLVLRNNMTQIWAKGESFKDDQYILATQVKQVFYLENMARRPPNWKVVEHVNHKKFSNGGIIVVEDDPDVIHFDNSSDHTLSTNLNDLDFATLHIDGQSTDVDAPPDIIDVDEDDDIIDEEDALPYDLADSDDEDLVNVDDDDDVAVVYSSEEED